MPHWSMFKCDLRETSISLTLGTMNNDAAVFVPYRDGIDFRGLTQGSALGFTLGFNVGHLWRPEIDELVLSLLAT
jgi:hypothetical protein